MDDIDREALRLCRQLPEAKEEMFALFEDRREEIKRLSPPIRKVLTHGVNPTVAVDTRTAPKRLVSIYS